MPTPSAPDLLKLQGFSGGIANRLPEHETPLDALRAADNFDILNTGAVSRRSGYTLIDAAEWHSLWSDESLGFAVGVRDGDLVLFEGTGTISPTTLVASVGAAEVSCAAMAGRVYWSNGAQAGMVRPDRSAAPWAIESPTHPPVVSANGLGGLEAGDYQIAVTFIDSDGRESGTGAAAVVTLTAGQGLALSSIPQPTHGDVAKILIYVSEPDGDVLHLVGSVAVGTTDTVVGVGDRGRPLATQWLQPMPPGDLVTAGAGRVYVASGNVMRWSDPMRDALHNPARNYARFTGKGGSGNIDSIVAVGDGEESAGLYVSCGHLTYFLAGADPANWRKTIAFNAGAVRGTGTRVRAGLFGAEYQGFGAFWVSHDGAYLLGLPNGQVMPLSEGRYVTPIADSGRVVLRRAAGLDQMLTVLRGTAANAAAFSDSVSAEVNTYGVSTDS